MHQKQLSTDIDTRAASKRIRGEIDRTALQSIIKVLACSITALLVVSLPDLLGLNWFEDLSQAGKATLVIMVLAAGLWITEAIPAFAVALLIFALEIAILGKPGGVFAKADAPKTWLMFVNPWSSSLMWLFFGGFILGSATRKTKMDEWIAHKMLQCFGKNPYLILAGSMAVTFVFSMFMSNTATAVMMMAVIVPIAAKMEKGDLFAKALILGIPIAANLGGMGTIIGTPPNAIAAGQLNELHRPDFQEWMVLALPPALILSAIGWFYLIIRYPSKSKQLTIKIDPPKEEENTSQLFLSRWIVIIGFSLTVLLWMTVSVHKIPAAVVTFLPIAVFTITGVLTSEDIRQLPWDVLLLLAGGLSLGVAIKETGLGQWMANQLSPDWPQSVTIIIMCFIAVILSNLMSNTATASIFLPIAIGLAGAVPTPMVVPLALSCSCAMMLPISTPPNAVAYSSGKINVKDFLPIGLIIGIIGPILCIYWTQFILGQ